MFELIFLNCNVVTLGILATILFLWCFIPRRPSSVPPGPTEFPIIGNIPSLIGKDTMECFSALRRRFGDVYGIYFGQEFTVILNGYDVIHDALVKNGDKFSKRPRSEFHQMMFKNQGIVFSNGKTWKESRKFVQLALNEFGYGWTEKSMEERINEEIQYFLAKIGTFTQPFDISETINLSVANVVAGIIFGERCDYDDPIFTACLHSVGEAARLFARSSLLMSCFSVLKYLPGDLLGIEKIATIRQKPKEFIQYACLRHSQRYNEMNKTNVLDMFKMEMKIANGDENTVFTEKQMFALMGELLSAGSETTATTIIWIIVHLIRNPILQKRLQADIDEVIGNCRQPALEDRKKLPLLEAAILEGLRIATVAPLSVPHAVHEDITFRGFLIPRDTTVLVNLHSVLKDPEVWPDPDSFRPERFLDDVGNVIVPKEFIPFCTGRRSCIGESLARMELFLYLASLLQKFDILPDDAHNLPSVEGHLGMTYSPYPFKLRLNLR